MFARFGLAAIAAFIAFGATGCSSGMRIGGNLMRKDSNLHIWLDGQEATQNTFKKAASGYSRFEVAEQVATAPKIKFELDDPAQFGRITMVQCQVHQKFEADYSHQAEFVVISRDTNNPDAQMKPGVEYDLGNPGDHGLRVLDLYGKDAAGVTLKPGVEYMISLTVRADKSETAQIYFKTK